MKFYGSFCLIFFVLNYMRRLGYNNLYQKMWVVVKLCFFPTDSSGVNTQNSSRKILSGVSEKVIEETSWLKCICMTWTHSCVSLNPRHALLGPSSCFAISISSLSTRYGMASSPSLPMPRIWQGYHVSESENCVGEGVGGVGKAATVSHCCRGRKMCCRNILPLG